MSPRRGNWSPQLLCLLMMSDQDSKYLLRPIYTLSGTATLCDETACDLESVSYGQWDTHQASGQSLC